MRTNRQSLRVHLSQPISVMINMTLGFCHPMRPPWGEFTLTIRPWSYGISILLLKLSIFQEILACALNAGGCLLSYAMTPHMTNFFSYCEPFPNLEAKFDSHDVFLSTSILWLKRTFLWKVFNYIQSHPSDGSVGLPGLFWCLYWRLWLLFFCLS